MLKITLAKWAIVGATAAAAVAIPAVPSFAATRHHHRPGGTQLVKHHHRHHRHHKRHSTQTGFIKPRLTAPATAA